MHRQSPDSYAENGDCAVPSRGWMGVPIVEEWTAWLLVRQRERELAERERLREAEQISPTPPRPRLIHRSRRTRVEETPAGRRAA